MTDIALLQGQNAPQEVLDFYRRTMTAEMKENMDKFNELDDAKKLELLSFLVFNLNNAVATILATFEDANGDRH